MSSSNNIYIVIGGSLAALAVVGSILMYDKHKRHLNEIKSNKEKNPSYDEVSHLLYTVNDAYTGNDAHGVKSKKRSKQHKHKSRSKK